MLRIMLGENAPPAACLGLDRLDHRHKLDYRRVWGSTVPTPGGLS